MIKMIWAEDLERGIARDHSLPWKIKEDMVFFKNTTSNHIVVMGKNTWDSLKFHPLKNRINYVLTRDKKLVLNYPDTFIIHDKEAILALNKKFPEKEIFIIGGKQIYDLFFPYAEWLIITKIKQIYHCDLFLNYDLRDFDLRYHKDDTLFNIEMYKRKNYD